MPKLPWVQARSSSPTPGNSRRGRGWISLWSIVAAVMLLLVFAVRLIVPLAGASRGVYASIDGIECERGERLNYHVHSHLALFVEGQEVRVPAGIGITDRCLYWLHTHATDGIIHVEAPARKDFTLGQFFAVWASPWDGTSSWTRPRIQITRYAHTLTDNLSTGTRHRSSSRTGPQ